MTQHHDLPRDNSTSDFVRATEGIVRRLLSRGIETHEADSPDDLVRIIDAIEAFERIVIARGGDLMIDEPPPHRAGEPDDPHFLLPSRAADESADGYVNRLTSATKVVQRHTKLP